MRKVQGQESRTHLRNASDWGGLEGGLEEWGWTGWQIMEDLIGYIRVLTLHPEHNGDHRRASPGGDLVRFAI